MRWGLTVPYFFPPFKVNGSMDPVIPKENYDYFNFLFGSYYAKHWWIGTLYFTREVLDRTYPGYGSSYPDYLGGIGLLQASSRGHKQNSIWWNYIPYTIRNQYISGITTVKAAVENKESLKE